MMKPRPAKWGISGKVPDVEPEPTRQELEQLIEELDAECSWYNRWVTDLIEIAMHNAKDSAKAMAEIEAARPGQVGRKLGQRRGADRNTAKARECNEAAVVFWREAKIEAHGNIERARYLLKTKLDAWAAEDPASRRSLALTTIQKRY
ncbi:MAG: hypothetical protein ABJX32_19685 [Tateyamaria sp.]|uniref:hypothetical protein n=1 Tax=Tateyamaria sp. TaxID=1929288 RepID=UPI00329B5657